MAAATKKRIVVADELGYCWGVRRALDIIAGGGRAPPARSRRSATSSTTRRSSSGCARKGVEGAASVDEAAERGFSRVAITAHGMGPHLAERGRRSRTCELIDTTCPLVTKVQRLAQKLVRQGYFLVVYGDSYHPEVKSVLGWAGTSKVGRRQEDRRPALERPARRDRPGQGDAAAQGRASSARRPRTSTS